MTRRVDWTCTEAVESCQQKKVTSDIKGGYVPDRDRCLEGSLMLILMDAVGVAVRDLLADFLLLPKPLKECKI
jgi:hypothetical protein